jgi:hypothetical protein
MRPPFTFTQWLTSLSKVCDSNISLHSRSNICMKLKSGHQWLKNNLNNSPTTGWAIDPFGHGSTVPYLLKASGLSATIIERIHYAWKHWMAREKTGDFIWRQNWAADQDVVRASDMLTHNLPYDLYSTRYTCGPYPDVNIVPLIYRNPRFYD